jgi:hypothetical protein
MISNCVQVLGGSFFLLQIVSKCAFSLLSCKVLRHLTRGRGMNIGFEYMYGQKPKFIHNFIFDTFMVLEFWALISSWELDLKLTKLKTSFTCSLVHISLVLERRMKINLCTDLNLFLPNINHLYTLYVYKNPVIIIHLTSWHSQIHTS